MNHRRVDVGPKAGAMMSETSALHARVVGYGRGPGGIEDTMRSHWLRVAIASSVVELVLVQRLAAALARARGLGPDRPRNLNRSVILAPR